MQQVDDHDNHFARALRVNPSHYVQPVGESESKTDEEKRRETEEEGEHDVLTRVDLSTPVPLHELLVEQAAPLAPVLPSGTCYRALSLD
jgi:hypothetical protein